MFLRLTVGLLCLLVLGYASRTLQEYLFDSTQKGQADKVAMNTLMAGTEEAPAALPTEAATGEIAAVPITTDVPAEAPSLLLVDPELAVLDPTKRTFAGRVVSADDSLPLAGVKIEREETLLAESDADGRFEIVVPAHASFAIGVVARGFGPAYVFVDSAAHGEPGEHEIELRPAAKLDGRVLDSAGAPRGGVRVVVTTRAELLETSTLEDPVAQRRRIHPPDPRWEALSNARGEVRLDGLPPDVPLTLTLWEADVQNPGVRTPLVVRAGTSDPAELPAGCLLAPARPLVLSSGEAREQEWRLGQSLGRYAQRPPVSADPPPLHAQTTVRGSEKVAPRSSTRHVTFQDSASSSANLATALTRARSLAGQIFDDKGRPIDGLVVSARPAGATGLVTGTTGPTDTSPSGRLRGRSRARIRARAWRAELRSVYDGSRRPATRARLRRDHRRDCLRRTRRPAATGAAPSCLPRAGSRRHDRVRCRRRRRSRSPARNLQPRRDDHGLIALARRVVLRRRRMPDPSPALRPGAAASHPGKPGGRGGACYRLQHLALDHRNGLRASLVRRDRSP